MLSGYSTAELFLVAVFAGCGALVCYTDIRSRAIKNRHILILLSAGFAGNIYLARSSLFPLEDFLLFAGATLFAGFLLYYLGIWSSGDGKFFFALSVAVPYSQYHGGYSPLLTFLANVFVPPAVAAFFYIMLRSTLAEKAAHMKRLLSKDFLPHYLLRFLGMYGLSVLAGGLLQLKMGYLPRFLLTGIFFAAFGRLVARKYQPHALAAVFAASLYYVSSGWPGYLLEGLLMSLKVLLLFVYTVHLGASVLAARVGIKDLKAGMIPWEKIVRSGNRYSTEPLVLLNFSNAATSKAVLDFKPDGLSASDVSSLKRMAAAGRFRSFNSQILIQPTVPFAAFILLGGILSFFAGAPVLFVPQ